MDSPTRGRHPARPDPPVAVIAVAAAAPCVGCSRRVHRSTTRRPSRWRSRPVPRPQADGPDCPSAARRAARPTRRLPPRRHCRSQPRRARPPGGRTRRASRSSCAAVWTGRSIRRGRTAADGRRGAVVRGSARAAGHAARSTWFAVDRPVYVALTLPAGSGPTPIQTAVATPIATSAAAPGARPGRRPVSAGRCRAPAPCRPARPAASGSRRRWPPTSAGTSRSVVKPGIVLISLITGPSSVRKKSTRARPWQSRARERADRELAHLVGDLVVDLGRARPARRRPRGTWWRSRRSRPRARARRRPGSRRPCWPRSGRRAIRARRTRVRGPATAASTITFGSWRRAVSIAASQVVPRRRPG